MTRSVSKDEFRTNVDELLREVTAGGSITVVEGGRSIASLVPSSVFVEAAPTVRRARIRGGFQHIPRTSNISAEPTQQMLDDLRGDK